MSLPKLKFDISIERDVETFFCFVQDAEYDKGEGMKLAILGPYPELKSWFDGVKYIKSRKEVQFFVQSIYNKNADLMSKNFNIYKMDWEKVCDSYTKLVTRLFPDTKWPDGDYIAYPTIWGMYPRFLENCTFQIPWKHDKKGYVSVVIAHELLHFIWYTNFYKKFPNLKDADDFYIWNISEIFNSLVQNSPGWIKVFGVRSMIYPMHKNILKKLENKYSDASLIDADEITQEIIRVFDEE